MDSVIFGKRLAQALVAKRMNQLDAALRSGISQPQISGYVCGRSLPNLDTVDGLITTLDLDPRILFPEWVRKAKLLDRAEERAVQKVRPARVIEVL